MGSKQAQGGHLPACFTYALLGNGVDALPSLMPHKTVYKNNLSVSLSTPELQQVAQGSRPSTAVARTKRAQVPEQSSRWNRAPQSPARPLTASYSLGQRPRVLQQMSVSKAGAASTPQTEYTSPDPGAESEPQSTEIWKESKHALDKHLAGEDETRAAERRDRQLAYCQQRLEKLILALGHITGTPLQPLTARASAEPLDLENDSSTRFGGSRGGFQDASNNGSSAHSGTRTGEARAGSAATVASIAYSTAREGVRIAADVRRVMAIPATSARGAGPSFATPLGGGSSNYGAGEKGRQLADQSSGMTSSATEIGGLCEMLEDSGKHASELLARASGKLMKAAAEAESAAAAEASSIGPEADAALAASNDAIARITSERSASAAAVEQRVQLLALRAATEARELRRQVGEARAALMAAKRKESVVAVSGVSPAELVAAKAALRRAENEMRALLATMAESLRESEEEAAGVLRQLAAAQDSEARLAVQLRTAEEREGRVAAAAAREAAARARVRCLLPELSLLEGQVYAAAAKEAAAAAAAMDALRRQSEQAQEQLLARAEKAEAEADRLRTQLAEAESSAEERLRAARAEAEARLAALMAQHAKELAAVRDESQQLQRALERERALSAGLREKLDFAEAELSKPPPPPDTRDRDAARAARQALLSQRQAFEAAMAAARQQMEGVGMLADSATSAVESHVCDRLKQCEERLARLAKQVAAAAAYLKNKPKPKPPKLQKIIVAAVKAEREAVAKERPEKTETHWKSVQQKSMLLSFARKPKAGTPGSPGAGSPDGKGPGNASPKSPMSLAKSRSSVRNLSRNLTNSNLGARALQGDESAQEQEGGGYGSTGHASPPLSPSPLSSPPQSHWQDRRASLRRAKSLRPASGDGNLHVLTPSESAACISSNSQEMLSSPSSPPNVGCTQSPPQLCKGPTSFSQVIACASAAGGTSPSSAAKGRRSSSVRSNGSGASIQASFSASAKATALPCAATQPRTTSSAVRNTTAATSIKSAAAVAAAAGATTGAAGLTITAASTTSAAAAAAADPAAAVDMAAAALRFGTHRESSSCLDQIDRRWCGPITGEQKSELRKRAALARASVRSSGFSQRSGSISSEPTTSAAEVSELLASLGAWRQQLEQFQKQVSAIRGPVGEILLRCVNETTAEIDEFGPRSNSDEVSTKLTNAETASADAGTTDGVRRDTEEDGDVPASCGGDPLTNDVASCSLIEKAERSRPAVTEAEIASTSTSVPATQDEGAAGTRGTDPRLDDDADSAGCCVRRASAAPPQRDARLAGPHLALKLLESQSRFTSRLQNAVLLLAGQSGLALGELGDADELERPRSAGSEALDGGSPTRVRGSPTREAQRQARLQRQAALAEMRDANSEIDRQLRGVVEELAAFEAAGHIKAEHASAQREVIALIAEQRALRERRVRSTFHEMNLARDLDAKRRNGDVGASKEEANDSSSAFLAQHEAHLEQDLRRWERKRFQLIMEERINWQRILSAVQQAPWRSARLQPFRRGAEPAPDLALGVLASRTVGGNGANGGGQGGQGGGGRDYNGRGRGGDGGGGGGGGGGYGSDSGGGGGGRSPGGKAALRALPTTVVLGADQPNFATEAAVHASSGTPSPMARRFVDSRPASAMVQRVPSLTSASASSLYQSAQHQQLSTKSLSIARDTGLTLRLEPSEAMWRAVAPERPHSALQQSSSPLRARKEQGERRHTLHSDGQAVPERRVQGERLERWVTATNGRRLNSR